MILPVRDHNPTRLTPYVTWGLIALNVLIFLSYVPALGHDARMAQILNDWAMIPIEITHGQDVHTLITAMFLHAGFLHLLGNMLFLWIFGDNLENDLGHFGFLLYYLACGLAADSWHILEDPTSFVPTIGASGAVAGVLGGYLLIYPKARVDVLFLFIPFIWVRSFASWLVLAVWFVSQVGGAFLTRGADGGVAYGAHIGGFIAGAILILPLWLMRGGRAGWKKSDGHPDFPPTDVPAHLTRVPIVRRRRR